MHTLSPIPSRILDLSEFIDALVALRRGAVIVMVDPETRSCVLDGARLMSAFRPLHDHGLVSEYDNPAGFAGMRYFRMTEVGKTFADEALALWRSKAWHERLLLRLRG